MSQELQNYESSSAVETIAAGVNHLKIVFVNAYFISTENSWVLVDTGMPLTGFRIKSFAEKLYGANAKPSAIVLTHGHFDHAGSVKDLAKEWNVPVYAHRLEMPYLTGKSDYPPQDPTVGGALAQMARAFPHSGIDLGDAVKPINDDGTIDELPGWKFIHTPGHTAGHVSLFREADKTLLAGDALATMNQDSWVSNLTEAKELNGPPAPFTTDWDAAHESIQKLAALAPNVIAAGHGQPITENAAAQLNEFANNFRRPAHGRYINQPAICDETGVVSVPPPVADPVRTAMIGAGIGLGAVALWQAVKGKKNNQVRDKD